MLVADGFTRPGVAERVVEAVAAGVAWVQLRDHEAAGEVFSAAAEDLVQRVCAVAAGVRVSVNGRLDVARALGCGLHVGYRGPSVQEARRVLGPEALLGFSAHTLDEARRAVDAGAGYLLFSPVFPTRSKPGHPGAGLDTLRAVCRVLPDLPVFALGGITPERVSSCRTAGAYGVAVLSGILAAADVGAAVRTYHDALATSLAPSDNDTPA